MSLEEIKEKALELKSLREKKDSLSGDLKDVNEQIKCLEEYTLSTIMDDDGISDVTIDGVRVRRGAILRGGILSSTNREDFKFLFDTNNDGALKKKLIIDIEGVDPVVLGNVKSLIEGAGLKPEVSYTIHHMTLSSILKELVSDGTLSTEDFDRYKIYSQPQIKVEVKEK